MLELKALFAQSDRDTLPLLPSGGFGTLDATASAIFSLRLDYKKAKGSPPTGRPRKPRHLP